MNLQLQSPAGAPAALADVPPAPMPSVEVPQVPYPATTPIPMPGALATRTWLQARPWVAPVGAGVVGVLLGLTIGLAAGRRSRRAAF